MAEYEAALIRERTTAGLIAARSRGRNAFRLRLKGRSEGGWLPGRDAFEHLLEGCE
jgi:DNA invertase Pin-like site-specific DNA recombinase